MTLDPPDPAHAETVIAGLADAILAGLAAASLELGAADFTTQRGLLWRFSQASAVPPQRLLAAYDAALTGPCGDGERRWRGLGLRNVTALYAPEIGAGLFEPGSVAFILEAEASGCGAPPRRHQVEVLARPTAPAPVAVAGLPGETRLPPRSLIDLHPQIAAAAAALPAYAQCPGDPEVGLIVADTTLESAAGDGPGASWREMWTVRACGGATGRLRADITLDGGRGAMLALSPLPR